MLMAEEEYKEMKQNEMKEDAMKSLEHRTYDSKREMDILDALDQVKMLNRRQAQVNFADMIDKVIHQEQKNEVNEMEKDIEQEAHRIYERMKIRRIRDYSDIKLNEDVDEKYKEDEEEVNFIDGNRNERENGLINIAINKSENRIIGNYNKDSKNLSYDSDKEQNYYKNDGVIILKNSDKNLKIENEIKNKKELNNANNERNSSNADILNKKRSFEIQENSVKIEYKNGESISDQNASNIENEKNNEEEIKKNFSKNNDKNKKNSIFDKIGDENNDNISDDEDSIEKDFEKNKEIFNFSGPNMKLKISKDANKNVYKNSKLVNTINKSNPNNKKSVNFLNPHPIAKSKPKVAHTLNTGKQVNNLVNKPKITGLSSLMSNYSTDHLSE
jgi:hypothetical protein